MCPMYVPDVSDACYDDRGSTFYLVDNEAFFWMTELFNPYNVIVGDSFFLRELST